MCRCTRQSVWNSLLIISNPHIYSSQSIYIIDTFSTLLTFLQFPSLWRHFGVHIVSVMSNTKTDRPDVSIWRLIPPLKVSGTASHPCLTSIFIPYNRYVSCMDTFLHYWHFYNFLVSDDVILESISCPPYQKIGRIDRMWWQDVWFHPFRCLEPSPIHV